MIPKDAREFLAALDKAGELIKIEEEIDWDLEAGAIARRSNEVEGPAVLCQKVKGYPEGYRLFCTPLASFRRVAAALGLDPDTPIKKIFDEYEHRMASPIKPVVVKDGPCKEEIFTGEKVNLFDLPVPMVHDGDGGRYLTWHAFITKDPDSDFINWGMYRAMVVNSNTLTGLCGPQSDQGKIFYQKYVPQKKPMPFAVALNMSPLCSLVSMAPIPYGQSEANYAGGLHQEPVELVKCETSDILVPAHAEIIIEGVALPDERIMEGPFGEFTGYRSSPRMPRTAYRVTAITQRRHPIMAVTCPGVPMGEDHITASVVQTSAFKMWLRSNTIPFKDVFMPPAMVGMGVVVSIKPLYNHQAVHIGQVLGLRMGVPSLVIVVEDDVDVYDMNQVMHALATKCHPNRGIKIEDHVPMIPLVPYLDLQERRWGDGARAIYDCTWPLDWPKETAIPPRSAFASIYPKEVQEKLIANWAKWGFREVR